MKVLIPITRMKDAQAVVASSVFSASMLCIYNPSSGDFEWLKPEELYENSGNLSLAMKRRSISSVICEEMPLLSLRLFNELGITIYRPSGSSIDDNLKQFTRSGLEPLTNKDAVPVFGCGSSCSSCQSDCA